MIYYCDRTAERIEGVVRETFIAYVGSDVDEKAIEQALVEANRNYDCTVKVLAVPATAAPGADGVAAMPGADKTASGARDDDPAAVAASAHRSEAPAAAARASTASAAAACGAPAREAAARTAGGKDPACDAKAVFGKIVLDSYAKNCRDPEVGSGVLAVGGYDLELLHDTARRLAGGRYDPHDRDADQRVVRDAFADFDTDAFNLLAKAMPFSAAFFDVERGRLVAARGADSGEQENYGNLFYGATPGGGLMFSNDEAVLRGFCADALPVKPFTYFDSGACCGESPESGGSGGVAGSVDLAGGQQAASVGISPVRHEGRARTRGLPSLATGTFAAFRTPTPRAADDAGIRSNYANARDIIALVNGIVEQAADETLASTMDRAFADYFAGCEPGERVASFVDATLEDVVRSHLAQAVSDQVEKLNLERAVADEFDAKCRAMLESYLEHNAAPQVNVVNLGGVELARTGCAYYHEKYEQVLAQVQLDEPVMLVGPAGSGKNFAVSQIAEGLGLPMYYTNNASNEFKLTGFIDAGGTYRDTEFYKAFKNGGVFFLDEIDNSDPAALIVINSALANGYMAFPHETIRRHPDFRCVAAANTWGKGSNLLYVGRNVLDGATLDRFDLVFFDYDRRLERALYPADDLLAFMWAFRDAVDACRIPHIVSTRAIGKCYKKELAGIDRETILRTNVIRSLSQDDLNVVIGAMKGEGASEHNPYYAQITAMRVEK